MVARKFEEVLEAVWTSAEKNEDTVDFIRKLSHTPIDEALMKEMEEKGWITHEKDTIILTEEGKKLAAPIIRAHRLAERLMTDALHMTATDIEEPACEFEHSLVPEVTESICTLLGHPKICPHGLKIPPGRCCREARDVVEKVAVSASDLEVGEHARIAYILPKSHSRLHKLMSFGINPGVEIQLHQKSPAYVIKCEQTEIALEKEVMEDIYVWRAE